MDSVQGAFLLRLCSQLISSIMGGMAVFCLYYAGQALDYNLALVLIGDALVWGGLATAIVYCRSRYLD
jgi:hypothetical protein